MRATLLGALVLVLLSGCAIVGGEQETRDDGSREFAAADVVVRGDGRILLAGLATRGRPNSEEYSECRGEGRATRDFAVVHLSSTGRIEGDYSVTEADLEACAQEVTESSLDADGGLRIIGVVRTPPGLSERIFGPGSSTPESRERAYAARFGPEGPFEESFDLEQVYEMGAERGGVRMPNGDWVVIAEDTLRERRDPRGLYVGTMSLMRSRGERSLWSFAVRAISPSVDLEEADVEWELFADPRRGFYGFAQYVLVSGETEVVLFRHRLDGRPDSLFGERGRVLVARGWPGAARAVRVPGGDLVVAFERVTSGRVILRRYTPGGEPVRSFGPVTGGIDCGALQALGVQADGKLVLACNRRVRRASVVVRVLPTGYLDRSFGRNGRVVIHKV